MLSATSFNVPFFFFSAISFAFFLLIAIVYSSHPVVAFASCFAACGHHLPPRIAIVFSLLTFLSCYASSTLDCFATRARLRIYFLLLPAPGKLLSSHRQVQVPHTKIAVSALSRSPLGRANTFSFLSLRFTHPLRISKCFFSDLAFFLSVSLSLISILVSALVLYLPNVSADITSSWFPPISFYSFSTTLSRLIPGRPFVPFSLVALSTMAGKPLFRHVPYFISPFQLCHVCIRLKWAHPQFCS